jgi:DNA-binding response OmpR family regulator
MNQETITKQTILIVDDDLDVLMLLKSKLKTEGFDVQISPNGENILDIIVKKRPLLILLDIQMDGVDGGTICHLLKFNESTEKIPVIMFSANDDVKRITTQCGADAFIAKPFDLKIMKETFERVLGPGYKQVKYMA